MIISPSICSANQSASMVRRAGRSALVAAVLLGASAVMPALAGTFDDAMRRTTYIVMTGDVNGDGQNDVLFKAVPKIIMIPIDDDLTVPIPIAPPSPSFMLRSTAFGLYTLVTPNTADLASTTWAPATQQVAFSGPSGGYAGSVTITAVTGTQASFVISMSSAGQLQIVSTTPPAVNPNPPGQLPPLTCDD